MKSIIDEANIAAAMLPFLISVCNSIFLSSILSIASKSMTLNTKVTSVKARFSPSVR
jgi:hypothetical protein